MLLIAFLLYYRGYPVVVKLIHSRGGGGAQLCVSEVGTYPIRKSELIIHPDRSDGRFRWVVTLKLAPRDENLSHVNM